MLYINIFKNYKNIKNVSKPIIYSFHKSVPNPEPYTNDNDTFSFQLLTDGYNKIISIKGSI